jgi:hypothetical protein
MGTESTRNMYSDLVIKSRYQRYIFLDISCVYIQKTMHGTMNLKFLDLFCFFGGRQLDNSLLLPIAPFYQVIF